VAEDLFEARGNLQTRPELVPEKDVSGEEERIGVYVCHCGLNIASVVDCKEVAEYAKSLPGVVMATDPMYTCSDDAQSVIKKDIEKHNLNRVIVAACTPRTHEPLFRTTCREAGLNPYLFEMANIREHDAWVHSQYPEDATEKAKELIRMAVARARLLKARRSKKVGILQSATVIGGGAAGMTAALSIAKQGYRVDLIEKGDSLGGGLKELNSFFIDGRDAGELVESLISAVEENDMITVHLGTRPRDLQGFIGNFRLVLDDDSTIETGAIIVATGTEELKPRGRFLYGESEKVMTQDELEAGLKDGSFSGDSVVMIQCVGARDQERPWCARTCCNQAVKNAMVLRKRNPDSRVFVLYQDMMTFGMYEDHYRRSQEELGVRYIRYSPDNPPRVEEQNGNLAITVRDALLGKDLVLTADRLVLSTPHVPPESTGELQKLLKVPRSQDGFFMEAHAKLRPLEFTSEGIYLCGQAQFPKEILEEVAGAAGAAAKACELLSRGAIETDATTAVIDEECCIGCGRCVETCMFSAISLKEKEVGETKAEVNDVLCTGCGSCASVCPNAAITPRHFEKENYIAMLEELLQEA
jgi:heterodisulfide reductase subunit A